MYRSKEILANLGLNAQNASQNYSALNGKTCYGQLLETATIGLDHIQEAAQNAPMVESIPANGRIRRMNTETLEMTDDGALEFNDGQQFMVIDGKVKGLFSGRFDPYQNGDALLDLHNALHELGVEKTAQNIRFDNDGARMAANVFMPSFFGDFNLLEDTGEDILLGVKVRNAHDGSSALGLDVMGIRTVCLNYNLWGHKKWGVSISHTNGQMVRLWKEALERVRKDLNGLPEVINHAKAEVISVKDVAPILIDAGLPTPYIVGGKRGHAKAMPRFAENLHVFNQDIAKDATEVTLWDAYNAGTSLLTHAYQGAPQQAERMSAALGGILTAGSLDSRIAAGTKALEALVVAE